MNKSPSRYGLFDIAKDAIRGDLEMASAEKAAQRLLLCEMCPELKPITRMCKVCGCFVDGKVKFLRSFCPKGKW